MESESNSPNEAYRECLRNHAATLGSYATDGCGEFTPDESSAGGLTCAACGCHRNFHRKVYLTARADSPLLVTFARDSSVEPPDSERTAKKRSRTKFSAEQKEKMTRFAEKIGWRIQRGDGDVDEIGNFCREIGVSRQVFKVWMHNHKNSASSSSSTGGNASSLTQ
ncbi:zinc-finger homeodomain protein 11-like [Magnolia sinica]|uniref:zinc-finger homeodomain protein 11-like n=1 Tax=Magnolia sinica TaxID=86752 RepID=UPI00265B5204|nr:zinc-finger homeodomain protein 11-like [Magnolia sinica]